MITRDKRQRITSCDKMMSAPRAEEMAVLGGAKVCVACSMTQQLARRKTKHELGLAARGIHLSLQSAQFPELRMFQLSHPLVALSSLIEYLRYPSMLHFRLETISFGQLQ